MLLVCKKLAYLCVRVESNICEYAGKVESYPGRYIISAVERQLFSPVGPARFCATLAPF